MLARPSVRQSVLLGSKRRPFESKLLYRRSTQGRRRTPINQRHPTINLTAAVGQLPSCTVRPGPSAALQSVRISRRPSTRRARPRRHVYLTAKNDGRRRRPDKIKFTFVGRPAVSARCSCGSTLACQPASRRIPRLRSKENGSTGLRWRTGSRIELAARYGDSPRPLSVSLSVVVVKLKSTSAVGRRVVDVWIFEAAALAATRRKEAK